MDKQSKSSDDWPFIVVDAASGVSVGDGCCESYSAVMVTCILAGYLVIRDGGFYHPETGRKLHIKYPKVDPTFEHRYA